MRPKITLCGNASGSSIGAPRFRSLSFFIASSYIAEQNSWKLILTHPHSAQLSMLSGLSFPYICSLLALESSVDQGWVLLLLRFIKLWRFHMRRFLDFPKVQVSFIWSFFRNLGLNCWWRLFFWNGWIVPGHDSTLAFGLLGGEDGVPVVAMLGRVIN